MIKKGFTLIELLVVIAIIAILAAILFPVFAQAKMAAKKTASLSNQKQIGVAIQIYMNDSDDVYSQAYYYNNDNNSTNGYTQWSGTLQPYVKNLNIFVDPGDKLGGLAPTNFIGNNLGYGVPAGQVAQNAVQDNQAPRLSYIANGLLMPRKRRSIDPMNVISSSVLDDNSGTILLTTMTDNPRCINDTSSASGVAYKTHRSTNAIKMLDNTPFAGENSAQVGLPNYYAITRADMFNAFSACKASSANGLLHIAYIADADRYSGGTNYVYADTHARFQKPEATINPQRWQWGKFAYTAGGGAILNPVNGQPVQ